MTELYVPVAHGRYPEDGEKVSELAFESKEEALNHGDEMISEGYGFTQFFIQDVEVVESE